MRVALTKKRADELKTARIRAGKSQYELANELGWVRSKVKRLEKGEVRTISEEDLKALERRLRSHPDVKEVRIPRGDGGERPGNAKAEEFFERVELLDRQASPGGRNCAFFRVRMKESMLVSALDRVEFTLLGYKGAVHGVENAVDQPVLRKGDVVVIMLWAPNILDQVRT